MTSESVSTTSPGPAARATPGRAFFVLAAAVAVLYALSLNNQWAIEPDSGLYLALGRSLAEGHGMEFNGRQYWTLPPGLPALIAVCRSAAGPENYGLINLMLRLFGFGTALLAAAIVWRLACDRPADERRWLATGTLLMVGVSATLFADATTILTDVPFAFLIALGLYAILRARDGGWTWYLVGAIAVAAASWTRLLGPILLAGMLLGAALDFRPGWGRRWLGLLAAGALVGISLLAWMFLLRSRADAGTPDYLAAAQGGYLDVFSAEKWADIAAGILQFPVALAGVLTDQKLAVANLGLVAILLLGLWLALRRRQFAVVLPLIFYVGFLIVWGHGAVARRYLLPVLPIMAYVLLLGATKVAALVTARKGTVPIARGCALPCPPEGGWATSGAKVAMAAVVVLGVAVSLPKDIEQIYWAQHPRFYEAYEDGRWTDLLDIARLLRERGRPDTDVVATSQAALVHYLTGLGVAPRGLWSLTAEGKLVPQPPKDFAAAAVSNGYRFVLVPTAAKDWSPDALREMEETRRFRPPDTIGHLALFERLP